MQILRDLVLGSFLFAFFSIPGSAAQQQGGHSGNGCVSGQALPPLPPPA